MQMGVGRGVPALAALAAFGVQVAQSLATGSMGRSGVLRAGSGGDGAVARVVELLEEMKKQVETEQTEDDNIYGKMDCWCVNNRKEKTAAVEAATKRLEQLETAIEEGTAKASQLATEISSLKEDIQEDQEALSTATAMRAKEKDSFEQSEAELLDTTSTLKEAIAVLGAVQHPSLTQESVGQALTQVRRIVSRLNKPGRDFRSVMQKDLWDLMGARSQEEHVVMGLAQQPTGYAAGVTSYGARSSRIFGLLSQMKANLDEELFEAQRSDLQAEIAFQRLRQTKVDEISIASKSLTAKEQTLADTKFMLAEAKEDVESTTSTMEADQNFLVNLENRCKEAKEDHAERTKTRGQEGLAISQTIAILMEDSARELFGKTINFIQFGATSHGVSERMQQGRSRAASGLLALARRRSGTDGWRLATLAVGIQQDGFAKVKEVMAKMVAELKQQQQEEYEKNDACKKDIDTNEDDTHTKEIQKEDLEALIASLKSKMQAADEELAELAQSIKESHIALKASGEQRHTENAEFQQVVSDQRATVQILKKAEARLQQFYVKTSLLESKSEADRQAPPPAGKAYTASGTSAGVLEMLAMIIKDAEVADQEAVSAEQRAQTMYAEFVQSTNTMLQLAQKAISKQTSQKATAEAAMLEAKESLASTDHSLEILAKENRDLHMGCDFLLKNYEIRQTARREEMDAINEAVAILSGANFGTQ